MTSVKKSETWWAFGKQRVRDIPLKYVRFIKESLLSTRNFLSIMIPLNFLDHTDNKLTSLEVRIKEHVNKDLYLTFVDLCIIVQFIKENPTRCNNVSKFYYSIFIWSSTCFRRQTARHQEPKTALAASGFSYVEGCWTCRWWTLSGTLCLTTSTTRLTGMSLSSPT